MRSYMDLLRRRCPSLSLAAGFWLPELTRGYPRLGAVRPVSSRRRRVGCARGWRRTPPTAAFSEPSRNLLGSFPSGGGASLLPRRLARPGRRGLRPRQGSQHTHPPGPRPRTQTVEIGTGRQTDESQKAALGPRRRGSHKHTHIRVPLGVRGRGGGAAARERAARRAADPAPPDRRRVLRAAHAADDRARRARVEAPRLRGPVLGGAGRLRGRGGSWRRGVTTLSVAEGNQGSKEIFRRGFGLDRLFL